MKKTAMHPFIKDLLTIAIIGGILLLVESVSSVEPSGLEIFVCFAITSIPFGWRWANKMFVAVSIKTFLIKVALAACLGCVAIFVIVIKDLIDFIKSRKGEGSAE